MSLKRILGRKSTGTAIGVLVFGWFAFESMVLAGDTVTGSGYHPLGEPLAFDVPVAGEKYSITIDRGGGSGRRRGAMGRKRLSWSVVDASGHVVLAGEDSFGRTTRVVTFRPRQSGPHTVTVRREHYSLLKRHHSEHIVLLVNRNDRSLLRRWLPWVW